MRLSDLQTGEEGLVVKVLGHGAFRKRITEMGFVKGKIVRVIKNAPLKDPIEYSLMGYQISLRRSEAALIEVVNIKDAHHILDTQHFNGVFNLDEERPLPRAVTAQTRTIRAAMVGNPNSGKTSLFNMISGAKQHVGNYTGVTVGTTETTFQYKGYTIILADLPGTYSISPYTPEELYVRNYILNDMPDVVINVLDASNLERNMFLTTQLIDMDIRVIAALNMYDELEESGDKLDYVSLGQLLGIPFIPTVANRNIGINDLLDALIEVFHGSKSYSEYKIEAKKSAFSWLRPKKQVAKQEKELPKGKKKVSESASEIMRHIHINYGEELEISIRRIQDAIWENPPVVAKYSSRFLAIKLLEKDEPVKALIQPECANFESIEQTVANEIKRLESLLHEDTETLVTDAKYGFIAGALKETYTENPKQKKHRSILVDNILTHRIWGLPIFCVFLFLMFQCTFALGAYPVGWLESFVSGIGGLVGKWMPDGMLKDLVVDGVIGGVGGVLVFLPNILILFFFISIMEDTGYMARVVFMLDKLMHRIGLHGRSFIPLIIGFGCNVPAVMATRTIESRSDRLVTMFINPFMSCSARLPVYVLFGTAFFSGWSGWITFIVYISGVVMAILTALLLKKVFFRSKETPFVMELPPYRIPTTKSVAKHVWERCAEYLKRMGGLILVASILIWALVYFPIKTDFSKDYDTLTEEVESNVLISGEEKKEQIHQLEMEKQEEQQEQSYIGRLGKGIEPVIAPLGFDWKMGVGLLAGVAAKEVVVSTLGVLYQTEVDVEDDESTTALSKKIQEQAQEIRPDGTKQPLSSLVAFCYMLFTLLYFPCIATVVAVAKESKSLRWTFASVIYSTLMAWLITFAVFRIGILLGY